MLGKRAQPTLYAVVGFCCAVIGVVVVVSAHAARAGDSPAALADSSTAARPPSARAPSTPPSAPPSLSFLQDESLSPQIRARRLIALMTPQEKIAQLESDAPPIEHLGVGAFDYWSEALHGVTDMRGFEKKWATAFPQCIGLAAMWDPALLQQIGEAVSIEARIKRDGHGCTLFCPNINIDRDPRWGRSQETYGEDPFLTARMAIAYIHGIQGDDPLHLRNAAVAKHFAVHSGPEEQRYQFDVYPDERDLWETYLPAFEACVRQGHVAGIMSAYNRIRGVPCCANEMLLRGILRQKWGFDGMVISDAHAPTQMLGDRDFAKTLSQVAAATVGAGCNITIGGGDAGGALERGMISEEMIDNALVPAFALRIRLGEFAAPGRDPYAKVNAADLDSKEHRELARQAARESIVLLKNQGNLLPLSKTLKRVAVIGPNANVVLLGSYSAEPSVAVSPYAGIRAALPKDAAVEFATGCGLSKDMANLKPLVPSFFVPAGGEGIYGLKGEYFNGDKCDGKPAFTRIDPTVDFKWGQTEPDPAITASRFSVRWTGKLLVPDTARYSMALSYSGGARLTLDGKAIVDAMDPHDHAIDCPVVSIEGGKIHDITLEYSNLGGDGTVMLGGWGNAWASAALDQAINAAKNADVVILCVGSSTHHEDEGLDRDSLEMPGDQEELIGQVASLGKPTVLVLLNGSALTFPWAKEHVPAIIEAWYPGEEGGSAIADVLFGDYNPAGRLPVIFYLSDTSLPPFTDYHMTGRTYRFFDGDVLYPFGYGLSYSHFKYSNLEITPAKLDSAAEVHLRVDVTNASTRDGDEVVQVYLHHSPSPDAPQRLPLKELKAFARVHIPAGVTQAVPFTLHPDDLKVIGVDYTPTFLNSDIQVGVGGDSTQGVTGTIAVKKAGR